MSDPVIKDRAGKTENGYDFGLIYDVLEANGIDSLMIEFDGSGDSGQIEYWNPELAREFQLESPVELTLPAHWFGKDQTPQKKVVATFQDAVEEIVYALIEEKHAGWENNDGAFGEIVFDAVNRTTEYTHNTRYTECETHSYEY